jgi:hypothetical protein
MEQQLDKREALQKHLGQRIVVQGRLQKFGTFYCSKIRKLVYTAAMQDLEIVDEVRDVSSTACEHIWVQYADLIRTSDAELGDIVRFQALVYKYMDKDRADHNKQIVKYGLRDATGVEVVRKHLPPAPPSITGAVHTPASPAPPAPPSNRELFLAIAKLVDESGLAAVKKALKAVEAMQ